jgi:ATP-dependent DNA ligase
MLAYPFEAKRLAKWAPPFIVQPKLDGERCRAVIDSDGTVTLYSSEANVIESVPHIQGALYYAVKKYGLRDVELDGELYSHGMPLDRENGIHAIVSRRVELHPLFEDMRLFLFDLVSSEPQVSRLVKLQDLPPIDYLEKVPFTVADTFEDVMARLEWSMEEGFEGIIVRHLAAQYIRRRSTFMMKFKPRREDVYQIVGFTQLESIHGEKREELGALICRGNEGEETFHVGTGFDLQTRQSLWSLRETLPGSFARVKYQHLTSLRGVPRSAVFVEIIRKEKV